MSEVDVELQRVALAISRNGAHLTDGLVAQFSDLIPELPQDPTLVDLLRGSTGSNLENLAHLLRGHVRMAELTAPSAAVEYARRLAQRGTPPSALLRAYRLGQQLILRWAHDEIAARVSEPGLALATSQQLTETSFRYIDAVSESVIGAYQAERDLWLANRSALQRETVDRLLAGDRLDLAAAEATLGYRLQQRHLALVLWSVGDDSGLADSERLVAQLGRSIDDAGAPLFVPRDRETAWAWLPVARTATGTGEAIAAVLSGAGPDLRVAVGIPETGVDGFRHGHLGAAAAHRVASLGGRADQVISYGDPTVRAAALLAGDLTATRRMVARTLGGLAADSVAAARLRETVLAFVEAGESYVAAGARLHLHKNTVKYRVDRAVEARGFPIAEDRLDLELALIACRWLGSEVLAR